MAAPILRRSSQNFTFAQLYTGTVPLTSARAFQIKIASSITQVRNANDQLPTAVTLVQAVLTVKGSRAEHPFMGKLRNVDSGKNGNGLPADGYWGRTVPAQKLDALGHQQSSRVPVDNKESKSRQKRT
ncbi:unnamed protein product [Calypogeia fissa]